MEAWHLDELLVPFVSQWVSSQTNPPPWDLCLMAELTHESPDGKLEGKGLTWEELAKDVRDWLETCRTVGSLRVQILFYRYRSMQCSWMQLKSTEMA